MGQEDIVHDRDYGSPAGLTGKIQTVTGLIDPEALGVCLTHEHLLIDLSDLLPPPDTATARAFYARPVSAEVAAHCTLDVKPLPSYLAETSSLRSDL